MDITTLTDEELEMLRIDIANETEKRQRLASIPETIADLANRYEADGGNKSDLTGSIS